MYLLTERSALGVRVGGVLVWVGVMDYIVMESTGESMNHWWLMDG